MKEASATSSIFKIVLAFTLLFSGFLSIAIVYNRAYRMKNESLAIIEKYEGINSSSLKIVNNFLKNSGYTTMDKCNSDEFGVKNLDSNTYEKAKEGTDYYYCISYYCSSKKCKITNSGNEIFYNLKLFFKFNLPFLGELTTFKIAGITKGINLYMDSQLLK